MIKTQSHVHEHGADVQVIYALCDCLVGVNVKARCEEAAAKPP